MNSEPDPSTDEPEKVSKAKSKNPLRVDDLQKGIKKRAVRGGAVTLSGQAINFIVQFGLTIVLARLLEPADFGLVAMVRAITGFVQMFSDGGLSTATIQRDDISQNQISSLFWINSALGLCLALLVAGLAPVVSWVYGEPRLTLITLAIAGTFVFAGLTAQHEALLRRRMRFKALVAKRTCAQLTGAFVAVALAWGGFGHWAIVAQAAAGSFVSMVLAWLLTRWLPNLPGRFADVGELVAFGGFVSGSKLMAYLRRNLDNFMVGLLWGPNALGIYRVAYRMLLLPVQEVNQPVSNVMVPTLSRLSKDPEEYRSVYRDTIYLVTSISLPVICLMLLVAEDLILVVLGERWLGCAPIFFALGPAAIAGVLNIAGGWVFVSTGKVKEQFKANIYLTIFIAGAILAGSPFGTLAIAWAFSAAFCISRVPHFAYAFKDTPVSLRILGEAIARPVLGTVLGLAATALVTQFALSGLSPILRLVAQGVVMLIVYAAANAAKLLHVLRSSWTGKRTA